MKKIKVSKNGPYLVSGNVPLFEETIEIDDNGDSLCWKDKKEIPHGETYNLCRCGKSKNMPFCDNSHLAGFDGKENEEINSYDNRAVDYNGQKYTLKDDISLCSSARFCDRAGSAWELVKYDDEKSTKILKEEVANCPSGRLVLVDNGGKEIEPNLPEEISATYDPATSSLAGPIWVKGGIEIEAADGKIYEKRNRVTLCRCDRSRNKPFCDSNHMIS